MDAELYKGETQVKEEFEESVWDEVMGEGVAERIGFIVSEKRKNRRLGKNKERDERLDSAADELRDMLVLRLEGE